MAGKGRDNAKMPVSKVLHQSIMGGGYVGLAGLLATVVAGNVPGIASSNPGMQRMIFAALFPVNLLLILMSGGQLFTGNSASVAAALYEGLISIDELVKSWSVSFFGNVIGCGLLALAAKYTGILTGGAQDLAVATAIKKCSGAFMPTVVKAIMCNWCVCMAVFMAGAANDLAGKMVGIWFPISMFVASTQSAHRPARTALAPHTRPPHAPFLSKGSVPALELFLISIRDHRPLAYVRLPPARNIAVPVRLVPAVGLEHSVANMFLLPLGLLGGAEVSIADTIVKNMVPATIGNAIAGAVVVAASYSFQFGKLGNATKF
jgi:formate/nitrite transporter